MVNIIMCDDDKFILQLAIEKIKEQISNNKLDARLACVSTDSNSVFKHLKNNAGAYLAFLDLDFGQGKLNGIDVAKQMKKINPNIKIVFVTNHHEMAMQVLSCGVEPFGFLEKTTDLGRLSSGYRRYIQMADSVLEGASEETEKIELTIGIDETVTVDKDQILYIESEKAVSHGVTYHTMDGSLVTVRDSMEHVLETLGEAFIRVHRSIIANKNYMVKLSGTMIHLSNGEEIPCSVRMRGEVKKCL
ncbi:response regulator [Lachnospiraceae bacterium KM106-2]|nr:response regulator [Lachnospiraceae bacterium KM106-2]